MEHPGIIHGRYLANTIELYILGGDAGCRYRQHSNVLVLRFTFNSCQFYNLAFRCLGCPP